MLIGIDVGNSTINIGYFAEEGLMTQKIDTFPLKNTAEYLLILKDFLFQNHLEKNHFSGIISSVVSTHTQILENALRKLSGRRKTEIIIVRHDMESGLAFQIDSPETLGADRIANAAGASALYGVPVAVVDFGTATTITVVDGRACCRGGAILPGIRLMRDSLDQGTSRLGKISLKSPEVALGRDTPGCIRAGIYYGSAGAVERILAEIENETDCDYKMIITGGHGQEMARFVKRPHNVRPDLILEGLRVLYDKNRSS